MKNLFRILLITAILGLNSLAFARVIEKPELEKLIQETLLEDTQKNLSKYGDIEVDIKVVNLPIENLTIQGEELPEVKITSNFDRFLTYDIKKVVFLENGKIIKTVPTNIRTHVFKNVLVATTRIGQFGEVNSSNTKIQRMEVGVNLENIVEKYDQNKPLIAVKPILQDNLVLKTSVKKKPDVVKDMAVKIQFSQNSNFNIELDGIAKSEGNIGDIITVKNPTYNKIHTARIISPNRVEVRLWKNLYWRLV